MIILNNGIIKEGVEYEDNGENIFPLELLTNEEKKELGLLREGCCKNKDGLGRCCKSNSGCSKGINGSCCKK